MKFGKITAVFLSVVMFIMTLGITPFTNSVQAAESVDVQAVSFTYTATSHSVSLTWNATGADKYVVYIRLKNVAHYQVYDKKVCETTGTAYLADYLDPNTLYTFGLQAVKGGAVSEITWQSVRTAAYDSGYTLSPVSALTDKDVEITDFGGRNLTISWKADVNDPSTMYLVSVYCIGTSPLVYRFTEKNTADLYIPGFVDTKGVYRIEIIAFRGNVSGCDNYYAEESGEEGTVIYNGLYAVNFSLHDVEDVKSASTANTITLEWSMPSGYRYDYFLVEMQKDGKWVTLGKPAEKKFTAKGLTSGTSYKFRITSFTNPETFYSERYEKDYSHCGTSQPVEYSAATITPPKISNLKIAPGKTTAKLTWSKNSSAAYYRVYSVKNGKFTQLTQTANNSVLSYTVKNLVPSASYTYRVIAFNSSNKSIASSDITTKTLSNIGNLTVSPGKTTAKLTWSRNPNAASYKILVQKNGAFTTVGTTVSGAYTVKSLVPSANYTLRVSAYNASGAMIGYSDITTKTLSNIGNLTVSPGKTTAKLTWSRNPNAASYKILVQKNGAFTTVGTTASGAYTVKSLVPSANYTLRISAYNASGAMIGYSDISTKTLSNIGNLTVTPYKNSATLKWSKNPNATSYRVLIQKNGTFTTYAATTGSLYTVKDLSANTSYTLRVSAYNASGKMIGYSDITAKTAAN